MGISDVEKMKANKDVEGLIKVLGDKDKDVRMRAAGALGNIKDARAVEPLIKALGDESKDVRMYAASALSGIGVPAVEPLIKALKDKDSNFRDHVAYALGKIKDARAVEPLIEALKDKDRNEIKKTNPAFETVTDIDGNMYQTVKIGNQLWMAENLKVTHYRNGDPIRTHLPGEYEWTWIGIGAYCDFYNQEDYSITYGRLYNWSAVNDPRGLAPSGWYVPNYDEWETLIDYLGGSSVAGKKMKETGTVHWHDYHENAFSTNESGFSALPSGKRTVPDYSGLNLDAYFWSSTEINYSDARSLYLGGNTSGVKLEQSKKYYGFSVRCVRQGLN